ncbi:ABC transporter substrate-binding protein [Polaromonas sp. YR568]|uniref:ABC transporter substrate-binding protein n=1 Tax=Polaromonas sp. YR568 TaxID=1855301 RepID=UPI003137D1E4
MFVSGSGAAVAAGRNFPAEPKAVTLQLKWYHQFQFAGYYAALNKGFYREEGLDVTLLEGGADKSALAMVTQGRAHFGIGDSDLLIQRINGEPLVALAAIFQHSPYVIMSRQDRNIRSPSDLVGARVMLSNDQGGIQLRAMLQREGIDPARVNILPQTWNLQDLVDGRVDAVSAYATVEPAWMRERGVVPSIMRSVDYGVDFYGDLIFTTEAVLEDNRAETAAFLRATRRGWEYAFANEQELVDAILTMPGVVQRGVTRDKLLQEAADMRPYVLPDVVEIGHLNAGRLEAIGRTLADLGMVKKDHSLSDFMYQPESEARALMVRWVIGGSVGVLLILALVLLWNLQIRSRVRERTRALQQEIQRRAEIEQQLKDSQEMVQLVFGTTAAGIVMNTPDGRLVMANPAYYATVGYSEAELRAMDTRELTHPDDRSRYTALRERLLRGELESFTEEKRYLKKGGDTVWVRSTVSMVRGADGTPSRVIAVTEDITKRRETEDRLRQSEALLAIAGRTAHLGGWSLDLKTR